MMKRLYILTAIIPLILSTSCRFTSCRENSESVRYARGLSQERLEKLYFDMERYFHDEQTPPYGYEFDEISFPQEFRDIRAVKIRPKEANIMLEGCFDEFVYLVFLGLEEKGPKSVVLSYPSGDGYAHKEEVLWKE